MVSATLIGIMKCFLSISWLPWRWRVLRGLLAYMTGPLAVMRLNTLTGAFWDKADGMISNLML